MQAGSSQHFRVSRSHGKCETAHSILCQSSPIDTFDATLGSAAQSHPMLAGTYLHNQHQDWNAHENQTFPTKYNQASTQEQALWN